MKHVIAIDGPAASGKGTLARNLARELGFAHMDTGALYRGVALELERSGGRSDDPQACVAAALALAQTLKEGQVSELLSNPELRHEKIGQLASVVASVPQVREALLLVQKEFANTPPLGFHGSILDGRDIGTVICPDAPLKLFVTASTEIRAQRRLKELHSKGLDVMYEAVLDDMRARDARDSDRKAAPLRPADDAVIIDSSHLDEAQMLAFALDCARKISGLSRSV